MSIELIVYLASLALFTVCSCLLGHQEVKEGGTITLGMIFFFMVIGLVPFVNTVASVITFIWVLVAFSDTPIFGKKS